MSAKDPRDIFRRFSAQAKKVLTASQQVAESMSSAIGSEHLLIALAITPQTVAAELLKEYAITLEQIRLVLSLNDLWTRGNAGLSDEARAVLTAALRLAARYKHEQIEPEHILLAMVSSREARAYQVIARVGVDPNHIRRQLESILTDSDNLEMVIEPNLEGDADDDQEHHHDSHIHQHEEEEELPPFARGGYHATSRALPRPKGKATDLYTTDVTVLAKQGKLDPMIGRERELARTVQVLARRTKNNPVLIGEPGVGKTAIVEGLAHLIATDAVPAVLQGRRLLRLDLGLLIAGTMYRGQFEERLKRLIAEVTKDPKIILFIDELHTVVGAGSAEGSMDAANILKPALARGELRVIGATTLEDYRKSIEKDAALERRFQTVFVNEPTTEEAVAILDGLRAKYEDYHGVQITPDAIQAAVSLSKRYIADRALPDKAIDLLDEAAAAKQIATPNASTALTNKLTQKLELITKQKERAIEREAFDKAAELRTKELQLRDALAQHLKKGKKEVRPSVGRQEIAKIVSQSTGIPQINLIRSAAQTSPPKNLEATLNQELIAQREAVAMVSAAIRRAQARITAPHRPLGSFLFLGPTGVGKTELARLLAREVFGSTDALIKLDMSEFMERHNVARLVGAPAGYIGFDEGGKLTEAIRRRPYALLLLDEVEKAHPDVQNLLLQILEDGSLSDAKGRRISFANTIIIMTANLGSGALSQAQALGFKTSHSAMGQLEEDYQNLSEKVMASVKEYFRPELLNRLDNTVIFRPLTPAAIREIVDLQLTELQSRLALEGYQLVVTPGGRDWLAKRGFDAEYGARPIRRLITETIENPLAEHIIDGKLLPGQTIRIAPRQEKLDLTLVQKA